MSDLPVCKLCKRYPLVLQETKTAHCLTIGCDASGAKLSIHAWRKLMYVPAKINGVIEGGQYDSRYVDGYNAAIDDLEKGGA